MATRLSVLQCAWPSVSRSHEPATRRCISTAVAVAQSQSPTPVPRVLNRSATLGHRPGQLSGTSNSTSSGPAQLPLSGSTFRVCFSTSPSKSAASPPALSKEREKRANPAKPAEGEAEERASTQPDSGVAQVASPDILKTEKAMAKKTTSKTDKSTEETSDKGTAKKETTEKARSKNEASEESAFVPYGAAERKRQQKMRALTKPLDLSRYHHGLDEEGDDSFDVDPWHAGPSGAQLIYNVGRHATDHVKWHGWVVDPYTWDILEYPLPHIWQKYRGPPGAPAQPRDAFRATSEGEKLWAWYKSMLEEETEKYRNCSQIKCFSARSRHTYERIRDSEDLEYDEGEEDQFQFDVYYDYPQGWDAIRREARIAAAALTEYHRQAVIALGWWDIESRARDEREEREGVVISELEKKRRTMQGVADGAENVEDWKMAKHDEMRLWLQLEEQAKND